MAMVQSEARIIVALHIGSDRSGFAYACKSDPKSNPDDSISSRRDRTVQLSAIYYEPGDAETAKVKSWGDTAFTDHERAVKLKRQTWPSEISEDGTYFDSFQDSRKSSTALLQKGFTLTQVISDYLRLIGTEIMKRLQQNRGKFGYHVSMNDIEWCVVLAHEWGDHAMELMKTSMERAGLVQSAIWPGRSPYPLRFVPELDVASYHSLRKFGGSSIQVGKKLLVVDLALVSSHITVHEVYSVGRSKFEVKQVAHSSVGVLDGQKQNLLMELLIAKMLPVRENAPEVHAFKQFCNLALMELSWARCREVDRRDIVGFKHLNGYMESVKYVEDFKCVLPISVQSWWKQFDVKHRNKTRISYDVVEVSSLELETVMKPYLENCLALIAPKLLSYCTPDVMGILLVGELHTFFTFSEKIFKDLKIPMKVIFKGVRAASEGNLVVVLDQVLPFTWKGEGKLSKDGAPASSSDGDGISRRSSSPKICEELPGRGSSSPSFESSNALGGGGASISQNEPRNTIVENSPKLCEELLGRGPTSLVFESNNALGGGGASITRNEPNNTRVEGVVKKYSWDQVLEMTDGLTSRELGKGGFGTVYLGKFENGKEVAVKVLNQSSQEDKLETFVNEVNLLIQVNHVNLLIQVNHVNLVKLLGYCQDKRNVVIYEYVEEGSIADHLHGEGQDKTK